MKRRSIPSGQSTVEYLIATSLLALALAVGPDSVLERLFDAVHLRFQQFTESISRP